MSGEALWEFVGGPECGKTTIAPRDLREFLVPPRFHQSLTVQYPWDGPQTIAEGVYTCATADDAANRIMRWQGWR